MSNVLIEQFAKTGATSAFNKLIERIKRAINSKGITLAKLVKIYPILDNAIKQIEAVLASKE